MGGMVHSNMVSPYYDNLDEKTPRGGGGKILMLITLIVGAPAHKMQRYNVYSHRDTPPLCRILLFPLSSG